jgi:hypothetical protein
LKIIIIIHFINVETDPGLHATNKLTFGICKNVQDKVIFDTYLRCYDKWRFYNMDYQNIMDFRNFEIFNLGLPELIFLK